MNEIETKKLETKNTEIRNTGKVQTDETVLYIIGWILLLFLVAAAAVYAGCPELVEKHVPTCLFFRITGFYCPGCGGTRAIITLLRGKLIRSFLYHPFVLYTALIGGWFMISQTVQRLTKGKCAIGMKYRDGYLWVALALVIINFFVKNLLLLGGIDVFTLLK